MPRKQSKQHQRRNLIYFHCPAGHAVETEIVKGKRIMVDHDPDRGERTYDGQQCIGQQFEKSAMPVAIGLPTM